MLQKNEDVQALVTKVKEEYGSIDILVNNAGITKDNLMLKMTEEDFEQVIDTNLKGAFLCIKHVSKIMLKQKRGHIINISSVVGVRGNARTGQLCIQQGRLDRYDKVCCEGDRFPWHYRECGWAPGFI